MNRHEKLKAIKVIPSDMNHSLGGEPFYITFTDPPFQKHEQWNFGTGEKMRITKVRKFNWWRKLLFKMGFEVCLYEGRIVE